MNTKRISIILLVTGIALLSASMALKAFDLSGIARSFMAGLGATWIAIGAINLIRNRNPNVSRRNEIAEKDERNIQIRHKAGFASYFMLIFD